MPFDTLQQRGIHVDEEDPRRFGQTLGQLDDEPRGAGADFAAVDGKKDLHRRTPGHLDMRHFDAGLSIVA
jgi:hypothetical protein